MVEELKLSEKLVFEGWLDADGEMEVIMETCGGDEEVWVAREDAVKIIEHLKAVFGI